MDRELKSLKKTVKQFNKIATNISSRTNVSEKKQSAIGRRIKKIAVLIFAGTILFMVLVPPFRFPIDGKVTSVFFLRQRPESMFLLDIETHKGIDLAAPTGTRVKASAPGIVSETGYSDSYGNYVRVSHLFGFETYYAHLSEVTTGRGRLVILRSAGSIGRVGSTGRSTGPHLHFEIRLFGIPLPPRYFLLFHGIRRALFTF